MGNECQDHTEWWGAVCCSCYIETPLRHHVAVVSEMVHGKSILCSRTFKKGQGWCCRLWKSRLSRKIRCLFRDRHHILLHTIHSCGPEKLATHLFVLCSDFSLSVESVSFLSGCGTWCRFRGKVIFHASRIVKKNCGLLLLRISCRSHQVYAYVFLLTHLDQVHTARPVLFGTKF